jgi:RHS repeat-associated protein
VCRLRSFGEEFVSALFRSGEQLCEFRRASFVSNRNRSSTAARLFSPYGEIYNNTGSTGDVDFTGNRQDLTAGLYDTPNRELNPSGRWISPDPAHVSWNAYSYSTNPLGETDPSGLGAAGVNSFSFGALPGPPAPNGGGGDAAGLHQPDMGSWGATGWLAAMGFVDFNNPSQFMEGGVLLPIGQKATVTATGYVGGVPTPEGEQRDWVQGCTGAGIPCIAVLQQLQPPPVIKYGPDGSIVSAYRPYNYIVEDNEGTPLLSAQSTEWIQQISEGSSTYVQGSSSGDNPLSDKVGWPNEPPSAAFVSAQIVTVRAEVDRELEPYRRKMPSAQIEQLQKQ